jgi:hypothetical protein
MTMIQQEMSIPEILEQFPNTKRVFERYGLYPERYKAMAFENVYASALVHQIPLKSLLTELNESAGI